MRKRLLNQTELCYNTHTQSSKRL